MFLRLLKKMIMEQHTDEFMDRGNFKSERQHRVRGKKACVSKTAGFCERVSRSWERGDMWFDGAFLDSQFTTLPLNK